MSTPTENSPEQASEHDALLDYAYGELDEARAAEFEKHLAACAKCGAELETMKRVRSAVRVALPLVEPPAAVTGALHAQLLHAAAQRKPVDARGGGKVLAFTRRVLRHPGYAAAAGLLIVGGAIGLQWSRGHLEMPPRAAEVSPASPVQEKHATETAATTAPAEPEAAPATTLAPKELDKTEAERTAHTVAAPSGTTASTARPKPGFSGDYYSGNEKKKEPKIFLETREGAAPLKVGHAAKGKDEAALDDSLSGLDGNANGASQAMGTGRVSSRSIPDSSNSLGSYRGQAGGAAGPRRESVADNKPAVDAKATAPMPQRKAEEQRQLGEVALGKGAGTKNAERYAQPPPPAPVAAAPSQPAPAANAAPSPPTVQPTAPAAPPVQPTLALQQPAEEAKAQKRDDASYTRTADAFRKKAEEAASSGRCDEAVKLYRELDARFPRYVVAPRDRLPYVKCLRQTGNEQLANEVMSSLKDDNMQGQVFDETSRTTAHRAKKAAPPAAKAAAAPAKAAPAATDTLK